MEFERTNEPEVYVVAGGNGQYPDSLQEAIETLAVLQNENPYIIQHYLLGGYKWGIAGSGWSFEIYAPQEGDELNITECKKNNCFFFFRDQLEVLIFPDFPEPDEYPRVDTSFYRYLKDDKQETILNTWRIGK